MNPWGKKNTGSGKHAGCPPFSQPRIKITLPRRQCKHERTRVCLMIPDKNTVHQQCLWSREERESSKLDANFPWVRLQVSTCFALL